MVEVKQLGLADLDAVVALRRQALKNHPHAFGATPEEDRLVAAAGSDAVVGKAGQTAIFGAFEDQALVGMAGLVRASGLKRHHKAIIWGMYVIPAARGKGVGRLLLETLVSEARGWPDIRQLHLSVTDVATEARRLYESAGFIEWGREPRSLQSGGRFTDEAHLAFLLE